MAEGEPGRKGIFQLSHVGRVPSPGGFQAALRMPRGVRALRPQEFHLLPSCFGIGSRGNKTPAFGPGLIRSEVAYWRLTLLAWAT